MTTRPARSAAGFLLPLALALAPAACDLSEPSPVPAELRLSESALVLDDSASATLTATVLDGTGRALTSLPSGQTVRWRSGDPAVASVEDGRVTALRPGATEIVASLGELSARAQLTVRPVPRRLEAVKGSGQSGRAGEPLRDSLVVRALDRHGGGVPGVEVAFTVASGGGTVSAEKAVSDAQGHAAVRWTLGGTVGEQRAEARLAGRDLPAVVFTTQAAPASPGTSDQVWRALREPPLFPGYIYRVWGASERSVYAAGSGGTVLHHDGSGWRRMQTGTTANLHGISGRSDADVYAVGSEGVIAHFDGRAWTATRRGLATDASYTYADVWTASDGVTVAVGFQRRGTLDAPVFQHWNGGGWREGLPGTTGVDGRLHGVWGASSSAVYMVGEELVDGSRRGMVLRYDGARAERMALPAGTAALRDVWGASATDVFAVGDGGTILHYDGTAWSRMESGVSGIVRSVWGSSGRDVYAVTQTERLLLRYDGTRWARVGIDPLPSGLSDVSGVSAASVFITGADGLIMRGSGAEWQLESFGPRLRGAWSPGAGRLIAVGAFGEVLRRDGARWSATSVGTSLGGTSASVSGRSASEVYAAGSGELHRFDGTRWAQVAVPGRGAERVHVSPSGAVYTVRSIVFEGSRGVPAFASHAVRRYNGGAWTTLYESESSAHASLTDVWARSDGEVYVVGTGGFVMRYDGTRWEPMSSGTTASLRAVAGGPTGAVFAVGDGGAVVRLDGSTWTSFPSGTTAGLTDVWASGFGDAYAVGRRGTLLHFDGTRWGTVATGTTLDLHAVWGVSPGEVYAVGDQGIVLTGYDDGPVYSLRRPRYGVPSTRYGSQRTRYSVPGTVPIP